MATSNLQALMTRGETELIAPGAKFLVLGLALLFLGRQEDVDATLEVRAVCNPRDTLAKLTCHDCCWPAIADVLERV